MSTPRELPHWAKELLAKTDMAAIMETMRRTEPDFEWFHENIDVLRERHSGEHVAVRDRQVIASNIDFKGLLAELESRRIETSDCYLGFVTPKDWIWVL